MTRAVILARVSTEKQATALSHSLGTQEENGRAICAREGWDVERVFLIPGESAYVDDLARRPQFVAAIDYAVEQRVDVLLVQELSRFTRSFVTGWAVIHRLQRAGVRLLDFNLTDYTADEDRAVFDQWAAPRSSRDHASRVQRGIEAQFARGLPTGDIPFGYRRVMTTDARGAVVPNTTVPPEVVPEEADAVRWLYRAYLSGAGYLAMTEELNGRGLRPRSKGRRLGAIRLEPNATFTVTGIQRILENPFYAGWLTHHGQRARGRHEPIIDEALFAEAQSRRTGGRRTRPQTKQLLSGIAICHLCERPINCQRSSRHYYYRERPRGGSACANEGAALRADAVHEAVEACIAAIQPELEPGFLDYVNRQARRPERAATARTRAAIEGERDRVLDLFIRGEIDAGRKDAYLSDIDRRLGSLPPDIDSASFAVRRMREFAEVWALASPERRFEAVRILLRSVRLDVRNGTGHEIRLDPWPDYIPLFRWRREFVGGIRPGGMGRSGVTLWLPESYAPAELGVVA